LSEDFFSLKQIAIQARGSSMTVMQLTGATWTRNHDLPGSPLFPCVKIYYPTSLKGLIEMCKLRPPGERLKAGGSHWALSTAAVSDSAFIETNVPKNQLPAMDQTLYEIVPDCLQSKILTVLKQRHPTPFDQSHLNENEGTYFIHFETGKLVPSDRLFLGL